MADKLYLEFNILGRTGKQCRERWHNHLDTGITKAPWTFEEELTLFNTQRKVGNKWAEISKRIPGRTDNSIKNHFYSTLRKQYRKLCGVDPTKDQLSQRACELAADILTKLTNTETGANSMLNELCCLSEGSSSESPTDLSLPLESKELLITGHQISVPSHDHWMLVEEEFPVEFKWTAEDPEEVFMLPFRHLKTVYKR